MLASDDGLTAAIGGDSWPTSSATRFQVSSAIARRIRSSGKVRPPVEGCCPPKKSTSSSPVIAPPANSGTRANTVTRDWRTVALEVLALGAGRRAGHGELRDVAVVDVVGGVKGVHQDEAVHAGLDVGLLRRERRA